MTEWKVISLFLGVLLIFLVPNIAGFLGGLQSTLIMPIGVTTHRQEKFALLILAIGVLLVFCSF